MVAGGQGPLGGQPWKRPMQSHPINVPLSFRYITKASPFEEEILNVLEFFNRMKMNKGLAGQWKVRTFAS